MIKIVEAIIVEGTYDKIKLSGIVDTMIITTGGFSIFKDAKKIQLIKKLAEKTGIIIFTDSDRAGFLIRNYIKKLILPNPVKHAYIPEVKGKEKRKRAPGKEGIMGVEGINDKIIIDSLIKSGCTVVEDYDSQPNHKKDSLEKNNAFSETSSNRKITKTDLFLDRLAGGKDSHIMRIRLCENLSLPSRISTNALIDVLNKLYSYDEYKEMLGKINV